MDGTRKYHTLRSLSRIRRTDRCKIALEPLSDRQTASLRSQNSMKKCRAITPTPTPHAAAAAAVLHVHTPYIDLKSWRLHVTGAMRQSGQPCLHQVQLQGGRARTSLALELRLSREGRCCFVAVGASRIIKDTCVKFIVWLQYLVP